MQKNDRDMEIKSAVFVVSNASVDKCPSSDMPEYAFIGRSNVGKSSLINMLTNNKKLAKTSATPGKTLLINHFLINGKWHLVDLPGYGFAQVSQQEKSRSAKLMEDSIAAGPLDLAVLIVDYRHRLPNRGARRSAVLVAP